MPATANQRGRKGGAVDKHPFRAAWETRDLEAWVDALAVDVVAFSPMLKAPFSGRDTVADLYDVLFDAFGEFELTHEFATNDAHVFFWRGEMNGRPIEGVDLLRSNQDGKISEITVLVRPLVARNGKGIGVP